MQIDMHYYGTYCLARTAGLSQEASRIIATSAQFVDDNAERGEVELHDASSCKVEATAHHTIDMNNIMPDDQRQIWVPFHFLPGNEGSSFTERLICRQDSEIAQQMCANHIAKSDKVYYLELIGIMAHVYADTFAHYGFSGVSSRKNRVDNESFEFKDLNDEIRDYILAKKRSFLDRFTPYIRNIKSHLAENLSGALGHGAVVTFPDRPYLNWKFRYEDGSDSDWRDNVSTFKDYCQKIHGLFSRIAEDNPNWSDTSQLKSWETLNPIITAILQFQGKGEERSKAWQDATENGTLFNVIETIPEYEDWNMGFQQLDQTDSTNAMNHSIYHFYQAASYHRWFVLRELLPKHGLMVI